MARGGGFEFVDDVFGGAVPRNFIPSVEKGVRDCMKKGILAGYPVVDMKVTLYDGSSHDVDSSDMAFQIAESTSWRSEEHTSELQSLRHLVCRLLLEKKKNSTRRKVPITTRA